MHNTHAKHSFLNTSAMRTLGKAFEMINRKKSYVNFPYLMKVEPPKNRAAINALLGQLPAPSRKRLSNKTPHSFAARRVHEGDSSVVPGSGDLGALLK